VLAGTFKMAGLPEQQGSHEGDNQRVGSGARGLDWRETMP
jgi:hypothetical protein